MIWLLEKLDADQYCYGISINPNSISVYILSYETSDHLGVLVQLILYMTLFPQFPRCSAILISAHRGLCKTLYFYLMKLYSSTHASSY